MGKKQIQIGTPREAMGAAIRSRMAERGVPSVDALAEACAIAPGTLRRYVAGTREQPANVIWRVAAVLGLPAHELVARADRILAESVMGDDPQP